MKCWDNSKFLFLHTILVTFISDKVLATQTNYTEVDKGLGTFPFLRSNLVPEYFKGILLNGSKLKPESLTLQCSQAFHEFISELRNNFDNIAHADNWALKSEIKSKSMV